MLTQKRFCLAIISKAHLDNRSLDWRITWFSEKGKRVVSAGYCESYDEIRKEVNWKQTFESIPRNL